MKELLFGGARPYPRFQSLLFMAIHQLNEGGKVVHWPCRDRQHSWRALKQMRATVPTFNISRKVSRNVGQGNFDTLSYWIEISK